jgi:hypothetical protein
MPKTLVMLPLQLLIGGVPHHLSASFCLQVDFDKNKWTNARAPSPLSPAGAADEIVAAKTTASTTTTTFDRRTCAELGWAVSSGSSVCGESDKSFKPSDSSDKCYNWKNQPDAEQICVKIGARFCTAAEAIAGVGKSTGCSMDKQFVWTSTQCSGGYTRVKAKDGTTECVLTTEKGPVRCCSDSSVAGDAAPDTGALAANGMGAKAAYHSRRTGGAFAALVIAMVVAIVTVRRQKSRKGFQLVDGTATTRSMEYPSALDKSMDSMYVSTRSTTSLLGNGPGTPPKEPLASRMTTKGTVYSL